MNWGTTFSHPYVRDYFQLPVIPAFNELLNFNFKYIRLGCYWDEIEREEGVFDFRQIEALLKIAEMKKQKIILTVGMKAPRHPEFYVPQWTSAQQVLSHPEKLLRFVEEAVKQLSHYTCVIYWQVENEPLDPSGPEKLVIPNNVLKEEVNLVRQMVRKPILLTLWGNKTLKDSRLTYLSTLADVVGIDLYYQIPNGHGGYWGPTDTGPEIAALIAKTAKPVWITELQTNPWKISPNLRHEDIIEKNLMEAKRIGVPTTLLWGYEYWYALKIKGRRTIWDYIRKSVPTK